MAMAIPQTALWPEAETWSSSSQQHDEIDARIEDAIRDARVAALLESGTADNAGGHSLVEMQDESVTFFSTIPAFPEDVSYRLAIVAALAGWRPSEHVYHCQRLSLPNGNWVFRLFISGFNRDADETVVERNPWNIAAFHCTQFEGLVGILRDRAVRARGDNYGVYGLGVLQPRTLDEHIGGYLKAMDHPKNITGVIVEADVTACFERRGSGQTVEKDNALARDMDVVVHTKRSNDDRWYFPTRYFRTLALWVSRDALLGLEQSSVYGPWRWAIEVD